MTVMVHKDPSRETHAFDLHRYRDQNENPVELRKNKLPRGNVFHRLLDLRHKKVYASLVETANELEDLKELFE